MLTTLITCTGGRPEAWKKCQEYMLRQSFTGPVQWIIVDDVGDVFDTIDYQRDWSVELYPGPKKWKEGINTQRLNLDVAIPKVRGDRVFIIEDDDWYSPRYLEVMSHYLTYSRIVGEIQAIYYNVNIPGFKYMRNGGHASLCQTAFHFSLIPLFEEAVNSGELYIDIVLWRAAAEKGVLRALFCGGNLAVGIKGMPGKRNIGVGDKQKDYMYDVGYKKLIELVGERDTQFYAQVKEKNHAVNSKR